MRRIHPEWLAVLLIILGLVLHLWAWAAPPRMDRAEYIRILVEAGVTPRSPREVAREWGYLDQELGRAAWNFGDLESEQRIARGMLARGPDGEPDS